jgi:hypothetical protein
VARWILSALALLATASAAAPQQAGAPKSGDLLTFVSGPNGMPLADFIERASEIIDAPIFFDPRVMSDQDVRFEGKVEVPREKFVPFFEQRLFEKRFVHLERPIGPVTMHSVMELRDQRQKNLLLKSVVRWIDRAELMAMSDRQALVIAILYCTATPAEKIVEALNGSLDESAMEESHHVEGTNAVLVHAFAATLAKQLSTLDGLGVRFAERGAAATPPKPDAAAETSLIFLHPEPGGLRLTRAIDAVTQLTGEPVGFDAQPLHFVSDSVREQRIDFAGNARLYRSNALAWLDAILAQTRLSRQSRSISTQSIQVLWRHGDMHGRIEARWVPPEELPFSAGEFVSTTVALEHLRSRDLVDAICCRFGGKNEDFVRAIQLTNAFIMNGAADKLAVYADIAHEIDRNATLVPPQPADK